MTCPSCGSAEPVTLLDAWLGPQGGAPAMRDAVFDYCCEAQQALAEDDLEHGDDAAHRAALQDWGVETRGLSEGNGQLVVDYGLELCDVRQKEARAFIAEHHEHHPKAPAGWRWGMGLRNGPDLVALVWVGRPVARAIDHTQVVEVNRLVCRRDLGPGVIRHACSKLYAAAAREAKRRGFASVITYTLESESGTSLRATGWTVEAKTAGGSWDTPTRRRKDSGPTCRKVRWVRQLRKVKASR